jgi:hypothetical protein
VFFDLFGGAVEFGGEIERGTLRAVALILDVGLRLGARSSFRFRDFLQRLGEGLGVLGLEAL